MTKLISKILIWLCTGLVAKFLTPGSGAGDFFLTAALGILGTGRLDPCRRRNPDRARRQDLRGRTRCVLWESPLIPNDPIVMRNDLSQGLQERVRNSFIEYGQGGATEKAALKAINNLSAFAASGNYQLIPIVDLQMYESVTLAMADGSRTQAQKDQAVAELYKRASRLSTAMSASRYNTL